MISPQQDSPVLSDPRLPLGISVGKPVVSAAAATTNHSPDVSGTPTSSNSSAALSTSSGSDCANVNGIGEASLENGKGKSYQQHSSSFPSNVTFSSAGPEAASKKHRTPSEEPDGDQGDVDGSAKKKKKAKSRKGLEKIFVCDVAGCNKSFTRLEHLGRHQLNHSPKEIYRCSWPDCSKSFVREDLQLRHYERHKRRFSMQQESAVNNSNNGNNIKQSNLLTPGKAPKPAEITKTTLRDAPARANSSATLRAHFSPHISASPRIFSNQAQRITANLSIDNNNTSDADALHTCSSQQTHQQPPAAFPFMTEPTSDLKMLLDSLSESPQTVNTPTQIPSSLFQPSNGGPFSRSSEQPNTGPQTNRSEISPSADLIDWLFSDAMLSSSRDFLLQSDTNTFLETPLVDLSQLSTPPSFHQSKTISDSKRVELLSIIPTLESNAEFTLEKIQHYIDAYWSKFHFQFPILHRGSFEIDNSPSPLVLSMIVIGAAYENSDDLAKAIAEPLRWIIFSSPGFHPPTRVWILQSLLLLEVYEKAMTTRKFHERAHIHHGATLQLIRRGTTLLDPSIAFSSDEADGTSTWQRWVEAESIKRAVFMAFILDVLHAVLFGHNLLMYPHEMRLSLPCDDMIWESTDDNRKQLLDKPTVPFLVGLKRLLNHQSVEVDGFGRLVLLCGIVSLSIQMSQQALQISSIGWGSFRDTWKSTLGRAFDFWKEDYELQIAAADPTSLKAKDKNRQFYIVLYHLSHISMYHMRYDLHVFCGDRRVLGRSTLRQDFIASKRHVYEWAHTPSARIAAFHSMKALYHIFMVSDNNGYPVGYSVLEDEFLHRPAMIVSCTFVFWAYAFCLEGPESDILSGATNISHAHSAQWKDTEWAIAAESGRRFLERMNQAKTPDQLHQMANKNLTVGLLKWVILSLSGSPWEIMEEMCGILDECVQKSLGREDSPSEDYSTRSRGVLVG
ncbi:fungal-specific transcription factor domain-containing protein [Dipodascopsis uninucleata]